MTRVLSASLAGILIAGILTMWVKSMWALALFQIAIFLLGAIGTVWLVSPSRTFHKSTLLIPLAVTAAWPVLQLVLHQAAYDWDTETATLRWCALLVVFTVALEAFQEPENRARFRRTLVVFTSLLAAVSTLQLFSAPNRVFWIFPTDSAAFVIGPFVYRNQYAAFIELVLPFAIVAALNARDSFFLMISAAAVMYASVIASGSRTGTILVSAEVVALFVASAMKRTIPLRQLATALGIVVLLAGAMSTAVGWGTLWSRFQESNPYQLRANLLLSSAEMIRDRPWLGSGLGTWPTIYPAYARFDDGRLVNQAHNDWIQWTAEGGLVFVAMLIWVFVWSVRSLRTCLWGIGVVAMFLHALVDYPFEKQPLSALCLTILGMVAASQTSQNSSGHSVNGMYTVPTLDKI